MEQARTMWTDQRLDDHFRHIDERFDQVGTRFDRVDADIRALSTRMDSQIGALASQFHALNRLLLQIAVGTAATILTAIVTYALTRI